MYITYKRIAIGCTVKREREREQKERGREKQRKTDEMTRRCEREGSKV